VGEGGKSHPRPTILHHTGGPHARLPDDAGPCPTRGGGGAHPRIDTLTHTLSLSLEGGGAHREGGAHPRDHHRHVVELAPDIPQPLPASAHRTRQPPAPHKMLCHEPPDDPSPHTRLTPSSPRHGRIHAPSPTTARAKERTCCSAGPSHAGTSKAGQRRGLHGVRRRRAPARTAQAQARLSLQAGHDI
jgi:hypothetical protein